MVGGDGTRVAASTGSEVGGEGTCAAADTSSASRQEQRNRRPIGVLIGLELPWKAKELSYCMVHPRTVLRLRRWQRDGTLTPLNLRSHASPRTALEVRRGSLPFLGLPPQRF